jgi:hypothetical protein
MASPFDPLIDIIHSATTDSWKDRNGQALAALFGTRYRKAAEKSVTIRAPEMKGGNDSGVPYAAYIHPSNADSGAWRHELRDLSGERGAVSGSHGDRDPRTGTG